MAFVVEELSFQMIEAVKPLMTRIRRVDRGLSDQLRRSASSVALNICEGHLSDPGNRKARYFTAMGSANESRAALRIAVAWGYVKAEEADAAVSLLRRILAMLWKLTR